MINDLCSLDLCHAFKLFNLRTLFNFKYGLFLLYDQQLTCSPINTNPLKRVSASPVVFIFVQCYLYDCLSFSPFSLGHCIVSSFHLQLLVASFGIFKLVLHAYLRISL